MDESSKKVMETNKIELLDIIFPSQYEILSKPKKCMMQKWWKLKMKDVFIKITWNALEDPANPRLRKGGPARI